MANTTSATRGSSARFRWKKPSSFSFAFASCAKTASTSDVFDVDSGKSAFVLHEHGRLPLSETSPTMIAGNFALPTTWCCHLRSRVISTGIYRFVYIWVDRTISAEITASKASSHEASPPHYEEYVPPLFTGVSDGDVPIYQTVHGCGRSFI